MATMSIKLLRSLDMFVKSLELFMAISEMKFKMMPPLLQKMLTPDMIHSSFFGNQAESFDGIAERKMWDIAQNDCIKRISTKSCETTAKYFSQDENAKPRDPYKATLYNVCENWDIKFKVLKIILVVTTCCIWREQLSTFHHSKGGLWRRGEKAGITRGAPYQIYIMKWKAFQRRKKLTKISKKKFKIFEKFKIFF